MLKFQNVTEKENFLSHVDWAGEWISAAPVPFDGMRAWKIGDRFGNAWDVTFTGDVGEFTVSGENTDGIPFKANLKVERELGGGEGIVYVYDVGRYEVVVRGQRESAGDNIFVEARRIPTTGYLPY